MHRYLARLTFTVSIALGSIAFVGCQDGYSNASGADLRSFGLESQPLDLDASGGVQAPQPLARFPATIATVRVQGANYRRPGARTYAIGEYAVVATRDVETDERFQTLASHQMIHAIVPLNHLALPSRIGGAGDLCDAARRVGADMLLIYTLDSASDVVHHIPELAVVTLGLLPEGESVARCTASAILLDARTGFTYAVSEASESQKRLTSAWGSDSAERKAIQEAEQRAFHKLIDDLSARWSEVTAAYASR